MKHQNVRQPGTQSLLLDPFQHAIQQGAPASYSTSRLLGEAVETVCRKRDSAFHQLNWEVLGNSWEHLHGHIHPRYDWEPPKLLHGPCGAMGQRTAPEQRLAPRHDRLLAEIADELQSKLSDAYES